MRKQDLVALGFVLASGMLIWFIISLQPTPPAAGGVADLVPTQTAADAMTALTSGPLATPSIPVTGTPAVTPTFWMTDALHMARWAARLQGVRVEPLDMSLAYVEDTRGYLVRFHTPPFRFWRGNPETRYTYFYVWINVDTGVPDAVIVSVDLVAPYAAYSWTVVTWADAGRYPIPDPVRNHTMPTAPVGATATVAATEVP